MPLAEATNPGDPRAAGRRLAAGGFVRSGKVRDLFEVGDRLLRVASDRLCEFDEALPTPIPDKGRVLTGISRVWFDKTTDIIPNHLLGTDPTELPADFFEGTSGAAGATKGARPDVDEGSREGRLDAGRRELRGRMMLCRRARVLPVE